MTWSGDRILLTGPILLQEWTEVADTFLLAQHYVETISFTRREQVPYVNINALLTELRTTYIINVY
jgi:hypothetical protein